MLHSPIRQNLKNSIRKYDTQDLQLTGYYRRGFLNELTAGVDFLGGEKRQLLGLEGLWVNWLSFLQLTPALSHEKNGHKDLPVVLMLVH